jgi:NAD(P)-dependent dehydrogenase (short-subunit alcohol dehydrogenase family)
MNEPVCLITGGTGGLGRATAAVLAQQSARVVVVGRDGRKGERVAAELREQIGRPDVDFIAADLSRLSEVRRLAEEFRARCDRLHVLINNAGAVRRRLELTADGFEATFAVSYLAPFVLTRLLLDLLRASAPARVINVVSISHRGPLDFDNLRGEKPHRWFRAYNQAKFAEVLFTYELARRLAGTGVTANCVHPGTIRTEIWRDLPRFWRLFRPLAGSPDRAARDIARLALSPDLADVTGHYFAAGAITPSAPETYDDALAKELWRRTEEWTGLPAWDASSPR